MTAFDDLTDIYELLIDWPKRLAREEPFFRKLLEPLQPKRLLDTACGTGHHAAMFHKWGLTVEAADISPAMLERARQVHGAPPGLTWVQRPFDAGVPSAPFDAVMCIGNSLALAPDVAIVHRALQQMLAALRPGGLLVVQVLNAFALPDGPCVWQKNLQTTLNGRRTHILKGVHRAGLRAFVELVVSDLEPNPHPMRSESVEFLAIRGDEIAAAAISAGAQSVRLMGDHRESPFDQAKSPDLILVAQT